jgi:hypothetical protein
MLDETRREFHLLQNSVCFFPYASIIADERTNLSFDSQLFLFLQGNKMNIIRSHNLPYIF